MNATNGRTNYRFHQLAGCLAVAVVVCLAPNLAFGQADVADAAVDEVATVGGGSKSLFGVIREGGVMMVPLLVCSFITLVFVFEKFISLRRGRVIPSPFVKRFLHQLREGKLDKESALELCHDDGSPVSEVFASGVRRWGRPTVEIEQAILDAEERSAVGLRRYLRIFSVTANISPLLGLLGTVLGMIRLFGEIADADAMGRVERLAGGISEALLTTASGLCVAIPALCFYVFFSSRVERLLGDVDLLGQELVGLISAEGLAEAKTAKASRRSTAA
jgi:biopolymer transport protein ExbB